MNKDSEEDFLPHLSREVDESEPQLQVALAEYPQVEQEASSPAANVCDVVHQPGSDAVQKTADEQEEQAKNESRVKSQLPGIEERLPPVPDVVDTCGGDEKMPTRADRGEVQMTALNEDAPKQSVGPMSEELPPRPQEAEESRVPRDVVRKSSSRSSTSSEDSSDIATDASKEARPLYICHQFHTITLPSHRRSRRKR